MGFEAISVPDYGIEKSVDILNRGFVGYFVEIAFDLNMLLHMVSFDGISMADSRVVMRNGEPIGIAMIARRGWAERLAGMAIVEEARAKGAGTWLMEHLINEARGRGSRMMELEVIEVNDPAIKLYQGCGFQIVRKLESWQISEPEGQSLSDLKEVDIQSAARYVTMHGLENLPWQLTGESLVQLGPPNCAFRAENAMIVITDPERPQIAVRSLVVKPESRSQGQAKRLLQAVMAAYPGKVWSVPALCPEEAGGFFQKLGFKQGKLSQLQMRRNLI